MTWTEPTTQNTGDLITAAVWNNQVVENLVHLHEGVVERHYLFNHISLFSDFLAATLASARQVTFTVPAELGEVQAIEVLLLANATDTLLYYMTSHYALEGEAYDTNTELLGGLSLPVVSGKMYAIDVSGVFAGVGPGHICGMTFARTGGSTSHLLLGLRLRYTLA